MGIEYFKDYYLNKKYIGSKYHGEIKDRDTLGFIGRKDEVYTDEFKLDNGRIVRTNTLYQTELQQICVKK